MVRIQGVINEVQETLGILEEQLKCEVADVGVLMQVESEKIKLEALEKQIPKKIKEGDVGYKMYGCPNCDYTDAAWSLGKREPYCPSCGQKLEWE